MLQNWLFLKASYHQQSKIEWPLERSAVYTNSLLYFEAMPTLLSGIVQRNQDHLAGPLQGHHAKLLQCSWCAWLFLYVTSSQQNCSTFPVACQLRLLLFVDGNWKESDVLFHSCMSGTKDWFTAMISWRTAGISSRYWSSLKSSHYSRLIWFVMAKETS